MDRLGAEHSAIRAPDAHPRGLAKRQFAPCFAATHRLNVLTFHVLRGPSPARQMVFNAQPKAAHGWTHDFFF